MVDFKRIRWLIREEERLRWAVMRAKARAEKTTAIISATPGGGGSGKRMEDDTIRLAMIREEHDRINGELKACRSELRKEIRRMKDPNQILVMKLRYIQGLKIKDVCDALGYSESSVFRFLETAERLVIQHQKANQPAQKVGRS